MVRFNLVIERLLISGALADLNRKAIFLVSISLSSGFSFQVGLRHRVENCLFVSISLSSGFSFQVQKVRVNPGVNLVSISLSSGFSFQGCHDVRKPSYRRVLFQSRYRAASHFRAVTASVASCCAPSFNLVIERLLISGPERKEPNGAFVEVSISLSSGFSFQGLTAPQCRMRNIMKFQSRYRAASHFRMTEYVVMQWIRLTFQSRYRAASHFRDILTLLQRLELRFNLVIERLLISGGETCVW